jgi:hypothetical protein
MNLLSITPFHNIVTTKSIPPNPRRDLPKPLGGSIVIVVQHVVPYFKPFKGPLNYPKYKKNFDCNVHVRVFKVVIKATNQIIYIEEIANMLNFTLRDNASDWCNNYM